MSWLYPEGVTDRIINQRFGEPPVIRLGECGCDIRQHEEVIEYNGKWYCLDCAPLRAPEEGDICADCGQPIDDDYREIEGKKICENCFDYEVADFK